MLAAANAAEEEAAASSDVRRAAAGAMDAQTRYYALAHRWVLWWGGLGGCAGWAGWAMLARLRYCCLFEGVCIVSRGGPSAARKAACLCSCTLHS